MTENVGEEYPPPSEPMAVARRLLQRPDAGSIKHWRGSWMRHLGSRWEEAEDMGIAAWVYQALEHATYLTGGPPESKPWAPNRRKVGDVLDALAAVTLLPESTDPPCWIGVDGPPPGEVVACENGLLHVATHTLMAETPTFFNLVSVPFPFDPEAPEPEHWIEFLRELWPGDEDAIVVLQEWFGYVLSARTDLEKILLLIGPARSGKGTIARVLEALMGRGSWAGPTMSSLGGLFGLEPLLGKTLAVISDARLGSNSSLVVERLLAISGEDGMSVDRKFKTAWQGKLPTRFMVVSNELPRFGDASGAISTRFVILQTTVSFLGHEDPGLTDRQLTELPGILNWALEGLERLTKQGRLQEPAASDEARMALHDLVSPVSAFVREVCDISGQVLVDVLYAEWKTWCETNGHRPTNVQRFGRDLRAVVPVLRIFRPHAGPRSYVGISRKPTPLPDDVLDWPPKGGGS